MTEHIIQFFKKYKIPSILVVAIILLLGLVFKYPNYVDKICKLLNLLNIGARSIMQILLSVLILLLGMISWNIILHKKLFGNKTFMFIAKNNVYWLLEESIPYCPVCSLDNHKAIPLGCMENSNGKFFKCHRCTFAAPFSDFFPNETEFKNSKKINITIRST